jgi:hypothetical protein
VLLHAGFPVLGSLFEFFECDRAVFDHAGLEFEPVRI